MKGRQREPFWLVLLLIVSALLAKLTQVDWAQVWPVDSHGEACRSLMKSTMTACEIYSTDYHGRYPNRLSQLTPTYLKELPVCPAAGKFNYHFESVKEPDLYTIYCQGHYHSNLSPNQPSANEHWFSDQPYVENFFKDHERL